jgi:hypothetical protein
MAIDTYVAESTMLRVEKIAKMRGQENCEVLIDIVNVLFNDVADRIYVKGKNAINSFADGDEQRMMIMGLKRFTKTEPFNVKEARRRIAALAIEANQYPLSAF